jgi:hypothetical protein
MLGAPRRSGFLVGKAADAAAARNYIEVNDGDLASRRF